MRKRRTLGGLAAAAVLAMVGVFGTATTASAEYSRCAEIAGGEACWHSYDDWFAVWDTAADGAHVEVRWATWNRSGTCIASGSGDYQQCDYDLPEGYQLQWALEIWDGSKFVRGTGYMTDCTSDSNVCM
jgi:hypothetical protein